MPTYEYACATCGHQWEEIQKISEEPIQECPSCKKATAKRQISGGNFILKGGGWYADLYSSTSKGGGKGGGGSSGGGGGSGGSGGESTSETKSESKPEPKPEPKKDAKSASAA